MGQLVPAARLLVFSARSRSRPSAVPNRHKDSDSGHIAEHPREHSQEREHMVRRLVLSVRAIGYRPASRRQRTQRVLSRLGADLGTA